MPSTLSTISCLKKTRHLIKVALLCLHNSLKLHQSKLSSAIYFYDSRDIECTDDPDSIMWILVTRSKCGLAGRRDAEVDPLKCAACDGGLGARNRAASLKTTAHSPLRFNFAEPNGRRVWGRRGNTPGFACMLSQCLPLFKYHLLMKDLASASALDICIPHPA